MNDALEQLAAYSERMLEAAKASRWEELAALQQEEHQLALQMKDSGLDIADARDVPRISRILENHEAVGVLVDTWRSQVAPLLKALSKEPTDLS